VTWRAYKPWAGVPGTLQEVGIMRKLIVGVVGAVGIVAAVTACGTTKTVSKAVPGPVTTKIVTETVVRKFPCQVR
jgi:hypothetical protein